MQGRLGIQADRDPLGRHLEGIQETPHPLGRAHRRPGRIEPPQVHVQLPVGKPGRDLVRPGQRQCGLADPRGPADRRDDHRAARLRRLIQQGAERAQLGRPAREPPDRPGQLARHRQLRRSREPGSRLGRVRVIGQADPRVVPGLLNRHQHPPVRGRLARRVMADDLDVKPPRDDDREHSPRPGQRIPDGLGLQQPEGMIDRRSGNPVPVIDDLPGMDRHPQPDPRRAPAPPVVADQSRRQLQRNPRYQDGLRHLRRHQHQHPVTAVLPVAVRPAHPDLANAPPSAPYRLSRTAT